MAGDEADDEVGAGEGLRLPDMETKRCSICGAPARVAIRKLAETERTFLCKAHADSAAPEPTQEARTGPSPQVPDA